MPFRRLRAVLAELQRGQPVGILPYRLNAKNFEPRTLHILAGDTSQQRKTERITKLTSKETNRSGDPGV